MGSSQGDKLRAEQGGLRQLAHDVRTALDPTITIAADNAAGDHRWSGPQAERIRGELGVRQGKLRTMADQLDTESGQRGRKADTADAKPAG